MENIKHECLHISDLEVDSNQNFLILDDDWGVNEMLKEFLQIIGFSGELYQAYSIAEAKKVLNEEQIHYVLCDWDLPDGQGINLLEEIRHVEELKELPVLMITGHDDVESMISCSKQGASDYLVKPFTFEALKEKLVDGWNSHRVKNHSTDEDYIQVLESERERLLDRNKKLEKEIRILKQKTA